jgi:hypothetical protein
LWRGARCVERTTLFITQACGGARHLEGVYGAYRLDRVDRLLHQLLQLLGVLHLRPVHQPVNPPTPSSVSSLVSDISHQHVDKAFEDLHTNDSSGTVPGRLHPSYDHRRTSRKDGPSHPHPSSPYRPMPSLHRRSTTPDYAHPNPPRTCRCTAFVCSTESFGMQHARQRTLCLSSPFTHLSMPGRLARRGFSLMAALSLSGFSSSSCTSGVCNETRNAKM